MGMKVSWFLIASWSGAMSGGRDAVVAFNFYGHF
jgi:hypothetical protein